MIRIDLQKSLEGAKGRLELDLQASFAPHLVHAIFGESGSGKTTFFKMLSGIITPDRGYIEHDGRVFFDSTNGVNLAIWRRKVGFVFQNYALFPHLSVYKNITFGLDKAMTHKIDELIALLNLSNLQDKKPKNLSGGQAQKVALARAILSNPDILLLDEPFSGLDRPTKITLQEELARILSHFKLTTFIISHDLEEVFSLAHQVHVLQEGRFTKQGSPSEVFLQKQDLGRNIYGKVLALRHEDSKLIVEVLVGDRILSLMMPEVRKSLESPKIGDFIAFDNRFSISDYQKI